MRWWGWYDRGIIAGVILAGIGLVVLPFLVLSAFLSGQASRPLIGFMLLGFVVLVLIVAASLRARRHRD